VNSFRRTKLLLTTFYDLLTRHFKKTQKVVFLKSEKNVKYVSCSGDHRCKNVFTFFILVTFFTFLNVFYFPNVFFYFFFKKRWQSSERQAD